MFVMQVCGHRLYIGAWYEGCEFHQKMANLHKRCTWKSCLFVVFVHSAWDRIRFGSVSEKLICVLGNGFAS